MDGSGASQGSILRGETGRGRRAWSQLWQIPVFYLGLIALLAVAASSPFRAEMREGSFAIELRRLRAALHEGADPEALVPLAERLLGEVRRHPRREGETNFLAGTVYYRVADGTAKNGPSVDKAIEYLERAFQIGVPGPDQPALHHRLGVLLFRRGDDPDRAVQLMAESIDQGADRPRQAYLLLVDAYLTLPEPDVEAALRANQKLLEMTDHPEESGAARYLRAELLLRKDKRFEALKELDRIPGQISPALRVKTRLLQAQLAEDEGLFHRAAATWKELLADAAQVPGGPARVLLAHGQCLTSADPPDYEAAANAWQQALTNAGPAGQAAGLRLGELRWFIAPRNTVGALDAWRKALDELRDVKEYRNPHLELDQARAIFERVCRDGLERREFELTQQVAELYKKLAAPGDADERWARAVEGQARLKLDRAGADKDQVQQAHALFHKAAVAYEQAALVTAERTQMECWWRAGQCYLAAVDLARAASALERFVTLAKDAKDESRLAEAWFTLAGAQASQGKKDQARQAYFKCMEFPATPFAWRARYQLALDEIERKNFTHAREILKQNLTVTAPGMDRDAHEKSIYKMAGLLLQLQAWDEAVWVLKEAARQYPNNASALAARDRLADCYRKLAEQTQQKIVELNAIRLDGQTPDRKVAIEKMRAHLQQTRRQWLDEAIGVYQALADELMRKAAQKPLTNDEAIVVRRAVFSMADMYFDRSEFAEALRRYQRIQMDYAKQVEGLHACWHIWKCVGVMVESPEQIRMVREAAKRAVKVARMDLESMPPDSPGFRGDGVWTKEQWLRQLEWIESQLDPPATVTRPNPLAN